MPVLIPGLSARGHVKGKGQLPLRQLSCPPAVLPEGGETLFKAFQPGLKSAVFAHAPLSVEKCQVFPGKGQADRDAHRLALFVEIPLLHFIASQRRAYGIQHGGFPRIILPYQDQGPVNVPDFHIPDGFEILNVNIRQPHLSAPLLLFVLPFVRHCFPKRLLLSSLSPKAQADSPHLRKNKGRGRQHQKHRAVGKNPHH